CAFSHELFQVPGAQALLDVDFFCRSLLVGTLCSGWPCGGYLVARFCASCCAKRSPLLLHRNLAPPPSRRKSGRLRQSPSCVSVLVCDNPPGGPMNRLSPQESMSCRSTR